MKFESKELDGVTIVKLTGQVRISTQNEFKDYLDKLIMNNSVKNIVLSMDGVIYMNSAGLGIIIDTYKRFKEKDGNMVLCNLMPDIEKLFEITKISNVIEVFNSESEAISRLS